MILIYKILNLQNIQYLESPILPMTSDSLMTESIEISALQLPWYFKGKRIVDT